MTDQRMRGVVYQLRLNRGFGFVRGEDGIARFMHASDVFPRTDFDTLYEGVGVEFVPSTTGPPDKGGGLRAIDVRVIRNGDSNS